MRSLVAVVITKGSNIHSRRLVWLWSEGFGLLQSCVQDGCSLCCVERDGEMLDSPLKCSALQASGGTHGRSFCARPALWRDGAPWWLLTRYTW